MRTSTLRVLPAWVDVEACRLSLQARPPQWWAFAYTLLGWLTVAVVAGVTAAVRRD